VDQPCIETPIIEYRNKSVASTAGIHVKARRRSWWGGMSDCAISDGLSMVYSVLEPSEEARTRSAYLHGYWITSPRARSFGLPYVYVLGYMIEGSKKM